MSRQANVRAPFPIRLTQLLAIAAVFSFAQATISAQTTAPTLLTNAADVLSLPEKLARQKVPVLVRGIVTAAEPGWRGQFFVQDDTAGVFVENLSDNYPKPGDVVEVSGLSQPGAFAPIISKPSWKLLGTAALPKGKPVPLDQLTSGLEDGQRVEISGIVRAVTTLTTALDVEVASGGNRIHIFCKRSPKIDPQDLIAARVRVSGTVAASFNKALRHLMYVVMFAPQADDFVIEQTEAGDPFNKPVIPLSGIAEYRRDIVPGQRVHVKGVVTLQRPGQDLFLQDSSGGLHVLFRQAEKFSAGEVVDVVGFPDFDHFLPVLDDALVRQASDQSSPIAPKVISLNELQPGISHDEMITNHAALVTIPAKLLERTVRGSQVSGVKVVSLLLQAEDLGFTAETEVPVDDDKLISIPIGSIVEATGVCFTQSGEDKKLHSMQLLIADSSHVRVLQKPSWFTPQRLFVGLGILFAVLVVAVSWSVMVFKNNSVLRRAQLELQEAHDQLEERVKERTTQLKFQITARKESELQFKAILRERTRLAQELHDTVEQTLTGIALQLDTTSKLFAARPEGASHHLELARNLVSQSQVDVRRSVWDLRSRALEQFDLPGALTTSCKQLTDGTNIHLDVAAKGRVRPLSETVEENLLRIAQESVTNVIKHSGATTVTIELDYGPQTVTLQIQDNGHGFEQDKSAGPGEGHFGLLGISERAKRLGAELNVTSEPGRGTTVRIKVPIEQNTPKPDLAVSEAAT
jgi:signal transduction histidine kinase